jgi:hypothetical protein
MRKRLLYAGGIVFVVGLILAFIAFTSLGSVTAAPVSNTLTLGAGSPLGYVQIFLNQSGMVVLTYNATTGVDFYFVNQTAFNKISSASAAGKGISSTATSLEGSGVYAAYSNLSVGTFPFAPASLHVPYLANATVLSGGNYYALFSNRANRTSQVLVGYLRITASQLGATYTTVIFIGVSMLLMVAGIIIALVSLFLKPKEAVRSKIAQMDEAARKEYEELEKRAGTSGKGRKK